MARLIKNIDEGVNVLNYTGIKIIESWANKNGNINSTENIIKWISELNNRVAVNIKKSSLEKDEFWYYDKDTGEICNKNKTFFRIKGLKKYIQDMVVLEQPIIIQQEIGYLGIICKEIDGVMNFLMQAKIEPGNINKVQISPTIQATKSNFTQQHGGSKPLYLEYFVDSDKFEVVVDQIQSEQSSRFYKKRNRNIIIRVECEIEDSPNHKWMTLGQIKELMKINNIVNMDTRTVLSCIPYCNIELDSVELKNIEGLFTDKSLFKSMFNTNKENKLQQIYQCINDYKMFCEDKVELVDLYSLETWRMKNKEYICNKSADFKVIFCDISIEGREVRKWTQPLFEAVGIATFGLMICNDDGIKKFLVKIMPEVGCFDKIEIGPTIQLEANYNKNKVDYINELFFKKLSLKNGVKFDTLLSEEGGRFYHEQNRNIIIEVNKEEVGELPKEYFWIDYKGLNMMIQINNTLNIQLRNLLSILEV